MDDSDPSDHEHGHGGSHPHHHVPDLADLEAAVVTVSSTRTTDEDPSGDAIIRILEANGVGIATREVVNDDFDGVQRTVDTLADRDDVDCIVTTGGTGITPDDVTIEAVEPLLDKTLPGFGELFRALSREEVGTRIVATRSIAGIAGSVPVFSLPGSENAARLGAEEIVVEEAPHLVGLATRETEEK